jgi:Protein of unknown function (DUF3592)
MTMKETIAAVMIGGTGAIFMCIGILWAWGSLRLKQYGVRTTARVLGYHNHGEGSFPLVEYEDECGCAHQAVLSHEQGGEGETMEVFYDPSDPKVVRGALHTHLWLFPAFCIGLGGIAFLVGVLIAIGLVIVE